MPSARAPWGDGGARSGSQGDADRPRQKCDYALGRGRERYLAAIAHTGGNIFVVEWVEVGRVTKLRKIA